MAHSRFQHLCTRTTIDGAARSQGANGWRCLISAVLALWLGSLSAQLGAECHTPDDATEPEQGGPLLCSVPTDWTFDDGQDYQNWPILVHRVWFHFIRPTDGGGIHAGDQEAAAAAAMASVNNRFSALSNPTLPVVTSPPIPVFTDSRIRFELKGISYHDVGVISSFAPNQGVTSNLFNSQYGIEQPFIINVYFFTNLDPNAGTAGGFASSGPQAFFEPFINMMNYGLGGSSDLLAHEFGHAVGLHHTWFSICDDDSYPDTYHPDANRPYVPCSTTAPWTIFDGQSNLVCGGQGVSNNIMGYNSCRDYLSPLQLSASHRVTIRQLGLFQGANSTPRKQLECLPSPLASPTHIVLSTVWRVPKALNKDLIVHSGATLTIKCKVSFGTEARLIIHPGGRVIVEGGYLTSLDGHCHTFWPGVSVWGINSENQFPHDSPAHQGILILNDAIVENAREAIRMWGDGWDTFGGVVQATNTVFRNCRRSAQFMAYKNFTSNGAPHRNNSYFTGCTFTVDDAYRGNEDFYAHVSLWGVDGITFDACVFENLSTTAFESHKRGHGIISLDASYIVDGICAVMPPDGTFCHENDLTRSRFTGLDHGINARNATTARGFIVRGSLFEDNICGVYTEGVTGFQVTNNIIEIGGAEAAMTNSEEFLWDNRHRAVFANNSWGFAIDDNVLNQRGDHAETEGIVVGYSRDHNDLVFRNTASGLERAYIGEGICADLDETYTMLRGLQFICNGNDGNAQNFWSRKVETAPPLEQPEHTIRTNQGDYYRPADNTFDQVPGPEGVADYEVTTENGNITYWHRNTGTFVPIHMRQSVVPPNYIGPAPATQIPANNCASKVLATIPYDEDHESGMMQQPIVDHLLAEKLAYGNTRYLYEQLIDGGSTDEVVGEITAAWPQDAWDLRDYLLSLSPYLSVAALKEAMDKEWFPDAMRAQICIANPDATKKEGFLDWLRNECLYPLPEYMLASIVASWESQTYRTALEAEMAHHHAEMSQAANLLLHRHHWDEDGAQAHELREVWQKLRTPAARYAEALTWLQEGNYAQADAVIRDIPDEHDLKAPEMLERERMRDFIALLLAAHADGRSEAELNTVEVEALQGLIAGANDRPATWISNLLCFHYQICRSPLTGGETGGPKANRQPTHVQRMNGMDGILTMHPNPASTWAAFNYDLLEAPVDARIVIRDVAGREVHRLALTERKQQVLWDTREVVPGSYTVTLMNAGRGLRSEPLTVRP